MGRDGKQQTFEAVCSRCSSVVAGIPRSSGTRVEFHCSSCGNTETIKVSDIEREYARLASNELAWRKAVLSELGRIATAVEATADATQGMCDKGGS